LAETIKQLSPKYLIRLAKADSRDRVQKEKGIHLFLYFISCLGSPMQDELPAANMMIPVLLMMQE
jgi:hypothetical protein